eukprot:CAMPEP_0173130270 /NCGR_PEP_ID=MMETSP1102-20130122/59859_1 /TAXON_ID=49646 /ORGANISM="Geminigera sp., Strain Caron Lab Isolate" /LENGTH=74 /DNA_ID=CAMNT_0014041191 /DNA_START=322 /DNA_END=546 /DNA_ORIENTATION=-
MTRQPKHHRCLRAQPQNHDYVTIAGGGVGVVAHVKAVSEAQNLKVTVLEDGINASAQLLECVKHYALPHQIAQL